ncbi:MAG: ChbG/HpnK family deacetylase [Anaerolineae bacterium]
MAMTSGAVRRQPGDHRGPRAGHHHQHDHFVGQFLGQGRIGVENLLEILAQLKEGVTEIMTHPGYVDEMLLRSSGYAREREEEVATLTDPRVREAVEELGIELVDFRALG